MLLSTLLQAARQPAENLVVAALPENYPQWVLFFSVSDGQQQAHTQIATGSSFEQAWASGSALLEAWNAEQQQEIRWLRVDVVDEVMPCAWGELQRRLSNNKRNYYRRGLAFDAGFNVAMLPQELGAWAILYDAATPVAIPNAGNLENYGKKRYGTPLSWPTDDEQTLWTFNIRGLFADASGIWPIENQGRHHGYRRVENWPGPQLPEVITRASHYLAGEINAGGDFNYGWFPCFDRPIPSTNALRHASSTYALLEGWEVTQDPQHLAAIERALGHLCRDLIRTLRLPDGSDADFLVDVGNEIKLGGNAVSILALAKYTELTGDRQYLAQMERLANGIGSMQMADKSFVHVLNYPDLTLKAAHRIIYYDGEAAFALMRLYGITRNPRWLQLVETAFDYFIEQKHWQAHDHWLSYCVNELTLYRPEARYYQFGLDNVRDHLDFVTHRITTYPTLLELMMAAQRMITRIAADEQHQGLLAGFDMVKFDQALEARARYLLNGFFWPELAMFFRNPGRIVGSFFIRHHGFRVRIDDVEHYLSGYVAYLKYARANQAKAKADARAKRLQASDSALPAARLTPAVREPRILFLSENLREVGNGIEVATLRRVRLFNDYLNLDPTILISSFNPQLAETVARFKASGRLPQRTRVMSLYDWLAPLCDGGKLAPLTAIAEGLLLRATDALPGGLHLRQYALPGREKELCYEDLIDARQRIVLRRHYQLRQQKSVLAEIEAGQPSGHSVSWASEALFNAAMAGMCLDPAVEWHFVVDKNRPWLEFMRLSPQKYCNGTLTSVLHSTHKLNGRLKASYAQVLNSHPAYDRLVVLTDEQQHDLVASGFPAGKLSVLPNHIDNPHAGKKVSKVNSKNVLCMARYSPEKRHESLIRVFEKVLEAVPDAQLHTYGVGPLRNSLQQQVAQKGLAAQIHINGYSADLAEIHRHSCCSVTCSDQEGFSLFGLESLAWSTPLVGFDVDYGPRALISHFRAGKLVADGDEDALAATLIDLLQHPGKLRALRAGAVNSAARFFTPVIAERWQQWWDEMRQLAAGRAGRQAEPVAQTRTAVE
ncbi:glycosyltransferase [Erwinia sp. Leaf53]|uniref:glycosyltransferase n=1 Tax=Erwinia sp. Leaf53 TaxID=1736225 RepID=UPI0006FF7C78|nr:glycosyltransferase [Erwinia sp. Leaf53]KQN56941.1 hypothetical protein ASF13_07475 [Erwinia sp. Leaf53]